MSEKKKSKLENKTKAVDKMDEETPSKGYHL
jgi:hypothetical protein